MSTRTRRTCVICGRETDRRLCGRCRLAPQDEASQLARIDRLLEREQRGIPLPVPKTINTLPSDVRLPVAPLLAALAPYLAEYTYLELAAMTGISERRLRDALQGPTVGRLAAERLLRRLGLPEEEVYPDGPDTEVVRRERSQRRLLYCADPHCDRRARVGRFCRRHATRLAEIREELEARGRRFNKHHDFDEDGNVIEVAA